MIPYLQSHPDISAHVLQYQDGIGWGSIPCCIDFWKNSLLLQLHQLWQDNHCVCSPHQFSLSSVANRFCHLSRALLALSSLWGLRVGSGVSPISIAIWLATCGCPPLWGLLLPLITRSGLVLLLGSNGWIAVSVTDFLRPSSLPDCISLDPVQHTCSLRPINAGHFPLIKRFKAVLVAQWSAGGICVVEVHFPILKNLISKDARVTQSCTPCLCLS